MTMMNLADHVIAVAQRENKKITNLQLQKILYFVILNGIKSGIIDNEWLKNNYDENFLVWRYGPVVESVYEKFSIFGASSIFILKEEQKEFRNLDDIIISLLNENPFNLVNKSHQHSHWLENEENIIYGRSNIPYLMEDLLNAAY